MPAQLASSLMAARWAACQAFHQVIVPHRRRIKKAKLRESQAEEHSSSTPKGVATTSMEKDPLELSRSADEWNKFCQTADEAAATSKKAGTTGKSRGGSKSSQGGCEGSKPAVDPPAISSTGKGSKRKGNKRTYLTGSDGSIHTKFLNCRRQTQVLAPRAKPLVRLTKRSDLRRRPQRRVHLIPLVRGRTLIQGIANTGGGPTVPRPLPSSCQPRNHWANNCPGDGTIPPHTEPVEWAGGLVLFRVTRAHPLIALEMEREAHHQAGHELRFWHVELVKHECQALNEMRMIGDLVLPRPADLPRLPSWAAPNGRDYWGRPWAYLDAPSGHADVGVSSRLTPPPHPNSSLRCSISGLPP